MFDFRCDRCGLTLYSASYRSHCAECGAQLEAVNRPLHAIPLAQPRRDAFSDQRLLETLPFRGARA